MKDDIVKAAGIIIRDKKLLMVRSYGEDFFVSPGGRVEQHETLESTLIRELRDELTITVQKNDISLFGEFSARAIGEETRIIHMTVYMISHFQGELKPSSEIEELTWIDSRNAEQFTLGSIFEHDVIPRLYKEGLIN